MATFTKGEIVLYPFPYTDLSNRKLRPCLVISNELREDILLCQISSKHSHDNYCVEIKRTDTLNKGLGLDSYARSNMLFTANKNQLVSRISSLKDYKYDEVVKKILELISR